MALDRTRIRQKQYSLICLGLIVLFTNRASAGPLSIGNFTQVKAEYQYTDYNDYTYPSPIFFEYGASGHDYRQPAPYIVDFPENRALIRVTQGLGINDAIFVKYQYSQLDPVEDKWQDLFNLKYERNLSAATTAHVSGQLTRGSGSFTGKMVEIGGKVDWAGFVLLDCKYGYYSNTVDTGGGLTSDAHSLEVKVRQSVGKTTALQVKYGYYFAGGEAADFFSNTLSFWISQYLPTKTAVHLEWREHWNGKHYRAWSPSIEVDQYLKWDTILTLRARYYHGIPTDPTQLEMIGGNFFESYSLSGLLSHQLFAETKVMLKYRHYWSDEDIRMNTYLIGLEHIL